MDWSSSWRIQSLQKCLEQSWITRLSCHRLPYQTCWMDQNAPGSSWLFAGSCQNDRRSEVWWQHRGPFWILFSISILGYWFELFIPSGNLAVLRILTWETDLLFSNLFQIGIEDSLWYTSTVGTLPLVLPSWRWNTVPEFLSRNHFGFSAVLRVPGTRQRGKVPSAEKDCNGITSQMRKKNTCSVMFNRSKTIENQDRIDENASLEEAGAWIGPSQLSSETVDACLLGVVPYHNTHLDISCLKTPLSSLSMGCPFASICSMRRFVP